jgi:hypothetical protein
MAVFLLLVLWALYVFLIVFFMRASNVVAFFDRHVGIMSMGYSTNRSLGNNAGRDMTDADFDFGLGILMISQLLYSPALVQDVPLDPQAARVTAGNCCTYTSAPPGIT